MAWLLACCAAAAQAEPVCELPPPGTSAVDALISLRSLQAQCHKQAPYLYALGRLLNLAGQYDEAIDPLEGALLYRPDHWPSQLEYAIALEGIGDHDSALALLHNLSSNPDVDPATQLQIAALAQRQSAGNPTDHRGNFGLSTGYDTNLMGSTHHTQFILTTPDGGLPVVLDDDQRARAGSFVRADFGYDGVLASNGSAQWRYSLLGSYRSNPGFRAADLGQWSALLERTSSGTTGPYLLGQHQALLRSNGSVLQQTQLGLGYDFVAGKGAACRQRLGLDAKHISYPTSPEQNGRYTGVFSQTSCPAWDVQVQLRAGQDQPLHDSRPGGAQRQVSFRVSKRTQLASAALALEWEVTRQQDQKGYSTLLDNNAQRSMLRQAYRVEYRWHAGALNPYIGFEWLDQRASLSLFELKSRVVTFGFRSSW